MSKKPLGSKINVLSGFAFPSIGFTTEEGMPLVRIRDINNEKAEINYSGPYPEEYEVENGDLLIGMDGDFNVVRWKGSKALLNQRVCKAKSNSIELSQEFLFWYLIPHISNIHRVTPQTTVKHLSTKSLYQIPFPEFTYEEQKTIANILDTLDTQIRQTEAIIAKLQQVKQGLLHDLLTRGINASGQLRSPREHSPELYKDSPLGWIPNEWELVSLNNVADVDRGKFTHRPRNDPRFYGGRHPFIQTGDVAASEGDVLTNYSQSLSDLGTGVSKEFPVGTIAVTIAANIADTGVLGLPMYFPDSVVGVVVKQGVNIRYVELVIRAAKRSLDAKAPQSAQKNINLQDLRPLPVPLPSEEEQDLIAERYDTFVQRLNKEIGTAQKLKKHKTGLMDDLLTGRIRVTNLIGQQRAS